MFAVDVARCPKCDGRMRLLDVVSDGDCPTGCRRLDRWYRRPMPVNWTRSARSKLHGFRRPHPEDPSDQRFTVESAWKRISKRSIVPATVEGRAKDRKAVEGLLAEFDGGPPTSLDPIRESYRAHLVMCGTHRLQHAKPVDYVPWAKWAPARALISFWAEREGIAFALEVLVQPRPFALGRRTEATGSHLESYTYLFSRVDPDFRYESEVPDVAEPLWWGLRAYLSSLDREAFAKACTDSDPFLKPLTKKSSRTEQRDRTRLLFALSRNPDLAADGIAAYQRIGGELSATLIAAAPDARAAHAMMGERAGVVHGPVSYDIVEAFDDEAAPLLQAAVADRSISKDHKKEVLAALRLTGSAATTAKTKSKPKATKKSAPRPATDRNLVRMELHKRGGVAKFFESTFAETDSGVEATTRSGDIGSKGTQDVQTFPNLKQARRHIHKLTMVKMREGYKGAPIRTENGTAK